MHAAQKKDIGSSLKGTTDANTHSMRLFTFFAGVAAVVLVLGILIEIFGPAGLLSGPQNATAPATASGSAANTAP